MEGSGQVRGECPADDGRLSGLGIVLGSWYGGVEELAVHFMDNFIAGYIIARTKLLPVIRYMSPLLGAYVSFSLFNSPD